MAALAEVDIYNLALSHCGSGKEVQAPTENSAEANACRRFYAQALNEMLTDFPWPFAKVTVALALVETQPTTEWGFAYQYPQDCVTLRRILGVVRNESRQTRVPYLIGRLGADQVIYTDWPDAVAEYTQLITDATTFSSLFAQALAFKIASYIAPRITAGDSFKLGDRAYQKYLMVVEQAKDNAVNEEQPEDLPDSEFIRARG